MTLSNDSASDLTLTTETSVFLGLTLLIGYCLTYFGTLALATDFLATEIGVAGLTIAFGLGVGAITSFTFVRAGAAVVVYSVC